MFVLAALVLGLKADGPVEFGYRELKSALRETGIKEVKIAPDLYFNLDIGDECYRLSFKENLIRVLAGDSNGEMYGLLEAAERIRSGGKDAWKQPVVHGKPYLADRGWNIFLPLPWDYDKNFVDNDPAALTNPKRWYFMDDHYWRTLFDQMARSRLNWLDIHGPYDLDTTRFPNLYAYFIQSEKFPKVGVAPEIKAKLLQQLNRVIDMAHRRGIKVSLMSYEARFDIPHNPRPGYQGTEAEVYEYTKEVVEKMIRQCPKLDKIGYRIGESGRGAEFFKCYGEAIRASGRDIPVYTRSWVTTKARVVPLARESSDFTVEIKYNGEHWGAPYIMQGGRTAGWYSYFWEDYFSFSGPEGKRMWPGVEIDDLRLTIDELKSSRVASLSPKSRLMSSRSGLISSTSRPISSRSSLISLGSGMQSSASGPKSSIVNRKSSIPARQSSIVKRHSAWPSQPYKLVWQVRANGTHRIFPFYQPHWTRSSILSMKVGTTSGYTVESMASYFPQEPRYYLNPEFVRGDRISPIGLIRPIGSQVPGPAYRWIHQRDEMYMACWGRLGYDPGVPDWKFDAMLVRKYGKEIGKPLAEAWKAASKVVPIAFMAYSLGPDHRNHAPELEWGGDTEAYLQGEPFDSHVFMSPREALAYKATSGRDGRMTPGDTSALLSALAMRAQRGPALNSVDNGPADSIPKVCRSLAALGFYYSSRISAAATSGHSEAVPSDGDAVGTLMRQAQTSWELLYAGDCGASFKPFTDRLRMHTHQFHWKGELEKLRSATGIRESLLIGPPESLVIRPGNWDSRFAVAGLGLQNSPESAKAAINSAGLTRAWLLEKPLPSSTFFHKTPMKRVGDRFVAEFKREPWGHCVAAEIELENGVVRRIPWWEEGRPYLVVPSMQKPTPTIYPAQEAMTYLKPEVLDPEKYGWLVVAQRAGMFHWRFDARTKRKLLSAVERGMNLLVMQQDYTSGRYPLDWLPIKPTLANRNDGVFDPGGALGMERVATRDAMWQVFQGGHTTDTADTTDTSDTADTKDTSYRSYGSYGSYSDSGWEVFGNGGVARLRHGKGEIWMVQARFIQRLHIPGMARNLLALLKNTCPEAGRPDLSPASPLRITNRMGRGEIPPSSDPESAIRNPQPAVRGPVSTIHNPQSAVRGPVSTVLNPQSAIRNRRPAILVDTGTEDAAIVTSAIPDFMNAHDLPFLTLGEVIAKDQGMDSVAAIPGPTLDDDVLEGKGREIANRFLRERVVSLSKRPTPATREEFEVERARRRAELFRCLGLDPMPPRPPLNVRVTGVIPRNGYRIGKIVFESRPRFYVTAHVYVPDGLRPAKLPAIVHVNGHWAHKKGEDRVQLRCAASALSGYLAIAIDSPGHSFEGNSLIERHAEGSHNDWFLVQGGTNATGYYVWDVMRALDYLAERGDVDMGRIGITGASGGGLATLYAFAADDRFRAAVPVVYMSSMELAPENGCLCNHVPGTAQIGDRSDVVAIQAPKPVLLIGAENDPEFPPEAMRLTHRKMQESWALLGRKDAASLRIFPSPHDYSKPMREAMIGFFDKHLRATGEGSPVSEPSIEVLNPEDRSQLVLDSPPSNERTMRDISLEYLANAPKEVSAEEVFRANGGLPTLEPKLIANLQHIGGRLYADQIQSEPGLVAPMVRILGTKPPRSVPIYVSDRGKSAAIRLHGQGLESMAAFLDILGTGELAEFELRYSMYLGRSVAFTGGLQIVAAARLLRNELRGATIEIVADGPLSSLAAMYAGLIDPTISKITAERALRTWEDAFAPGQSPYLVQPRAHLLGPLEGLRAKVKNSNWKFGIPLAPVPRTLQLQPECK